MGEENISSTPYDDVFLTLLQDCSTLILPVLNELFHRNYTGETEKIVFEKDKLIISQQDGQEKRTTDSLFSVEDAAHGKKYYPIECQSTPDNSMMLRMFEYDSQIALNHCELVGDTLKVKFPESAVLYLRHNQNTPDVLKIEINTPGGSVTYGMPTLKVQRYDIDMIFEKKMLFLVPFYIFTYESSLKEINASPEKLKQLTLDFSDITQKLDKLAIAGEISEYVKKTICSMSEKVVENLAKNQEKVKEGVVKVMGGKVLEYEAKDILNRGRQEGIELALKYLVETNQISKEQAEQCLQVEIDTKEQKQEQKKQNIRKMGKSR